MIYDQFVFHVLKVRDAFQEVVGAEQLDIRNKVNPSPL